MASFKPDTRARVEKFKKFQRRPATSSKLKVVKGLLLETASPLLAVEKKLKGLASKRLSLLVLIYGEAGIGKTRAVSILLQHTPCASLTCRAVSPLDQVISALPRPKHLPNWLARKLDQHDSSLETLAALLEVNAPFVLHVEDLHEANETQQSLWRNFASLAGRSKGVGVLFTSRVRLELPAEMLKLESLSFEASSALLEAEVGTVLPSDATNWIYARARGNPLFTLEFFKHLARHGLLWNDTKRWHWREPPSDSMPVTVEALIEQLLSGFMDTPASKILLQARALLEIRVPQLTLADNLLSEVTAITTIEIQSTHLDLRHQGVLNAEGFVHPLFREVSFKQLTPQEVQTLANRALTALQNDHPEFAAEFIADSHLPAETAHATLMACSSALASQPTRAAQLKAQAAHYLTGIPKAALLLEAADGLIHSDPTQALRLAETILEIADLPREIQAKAVYHATFAIVTTTRNMAAAEQSLNRLPTAEGQSTRHLAALMGYLMMCGQPVRALEIWDNNLHLQEIADTAVLVHVLSALMLTGQLARAEEFSDQMLQQPHVTKRERLGILNIQAITLAQLGKLEESQRIGLDAIALAEELEQHNAVGAMLLNRAITLERQGQRESMREAASRALTALEKAGNQGLAAQAQLILANDDFESGRYEPAEERLNSAYSSLKQSTVTPFLVSVMLSLVRFHVQRQLQYSLTLALKYAREALKNAQRLAQEKWIAAAQIHLGLVLTQLGQQGEASELILSAFPSLKDAADATSLYALVAKAKLEEICGQNAIPTWHDAIIQAEKFGFLFDANCFKLELARLEQNRNNAQELQAWFEEKGLLHGKMLCLRYFPELEIEPLVQTGFASRLEVLGSLQVSQKGITTAVKGQKRKELLAALLEARIAGKSEVKSLELLDALYPNVGETEAMASLKQTVFKTRSIHGTQMIITTSNGYALGATSSDAEEFLQFGNMALWRGVYLDGLPSSDEVRETLALKLRQQAEAALIDNPKETIRVTRLLLESDPYDLSALSLACQALRLENNYRSLQRIYAMARERLLEVDEVLPAQWQEFLNHSSQESAKKQQKLTTD